MNNEFFGFRLTRWGGAVALMLVGAWFVVEPAMARTCQQMEMRTAEQFDAEQFANAKPAVGEKAPELKLKTLDGETVKLADYLGKNVVVIKAGYT